MPRSDRARSPAAGGPLRRAVSNPPNPWASTHVEWLEPRPARLEVYEERAKSLLVRNRSPDVPFDWGANPYRGCQHACAYCYARRGHQHLSWGAGTDFETKLVVKTNAAECLERELSRRSWRGDAIHFSGVTDCYQPLEAAYRLTRRCLEVCLRHENPVAVITKAALVRRDAELLAELHAVADARVVLSVAWADDALARRLEPGVTAPSKRFEALAALAAAGVPTGVMIAPLIPGLNETEVPAILERAQAAGARWAGIGLLHLTADVLPVFRERLEAAFPERAARVLSGLRDMRDGQLTESRPGVRMRGSGARWEATTRLFQLTCKRLGLDHGRERRPPRRRRPIQGELFS